MRAGCLGAVSKYARFGYGTLVGPIAEPYSVRSENVVESFICSDFLARAVRSLTAEYMDEKDA